VFLNESLVAEANFRGIDLMSAAIERIQKSRLAKALLNQPLPYFQCRTRTRVAEKRPASHTHALDLLFIARNAEKRKRQSKFSHESLRRWFQERAKGPNVSLGPLTSQSWSRPLLS